ncbi:hypothetical protein M8C21_018473, partial [Ambrosia artemisiifolia]
IMPNLKIVKLEKLDYLTTFPDVSGAPNIEELFVCNCMKLGKFHKSLGSHKRISKLDVIDCKRLKRLPSRFEMESLVSLKVNRCSSLETFPDLSPCMVKLSCIHTDFCSGIEGLLSSPGYLSSLKYLLLGRYESPWIIHIPRCEKYSEKHGCPGKIISKMWMSTLRSIDEINNHLETLTHLNLSCRPTESELFLKNLQSFSSLIDLDLSKNNNLIQLPATISHLSSLTWLKLNECHRLQILQGLPSSIEYLEANNCYSLEKIDDLSEEKYDRLDYISLVNCEKLVKDEDSKRCLDKMLQESFIKRWCTARWTWGKSIVIPGNKIPRWFKEEEAGCEIRVMIPPNRNKQIQGIAICVVFPPVEELQGTYNYLNVRGKFKNVDEVTFTHNQSHIPNSVSDSVLADCRSIWVFEDEDWSEGGTLLISISVKRI